MKLSLELLFQLQATIVLFAPAALLVLIGVPSLLGYRLHETLVVLLTKFAIAAGALALIGVAISVCLGPEPAATLHFGDWVALESEHFHFRVEFVFDLLSISFAMLTYLLCGIVGVFASNYIHREPGFHRFFVCFAMFLLGMVITSLSGSIETMFFGWELVGLSSALLVAFYHDRAMTTRNGMRVWSVYRISDAAFLIAAIVLHHLAGEGEFGQLMGVNTWPWDQSTLTAGQTLLVGALLILAAAGKSALVPFSGWLPRAMEGPTPSSAIFYGALSVHLGAFLLLRMHPVWDSSPLLSWIVTGLGLVTACFAGLAVRVQSDIKSALAFASLTQVGVIVAEIGLGFRYLPLFHIIGHACLRTLQLLRAPSLLRDYHTLENAMGRRLTNTNRWWERVLPTSVRIWIYRFALERGYLDQCLERVVVSPVLALFRRCELYERRWTGFLSGRPVSSRERLPPATDAHEELS